jgi:transposase-like protein
LACVSEYLDKILAMARLSTDKLKALKRAFIESAMAPGQAAQATGVDEATAKRWYDR